MDPILEPIATAIKAGKRNDAADATEAAIAAGIDAKDILAALMAGMDDVGVRFKANQCFVPEVLVAARAMKNCMELIEPQLISADATPKHTIVLGTVEGDLHDIGKNLVAVMLRGSGFEVVDLGVNIPPRAFIAAIEKHQPDLIGLSALLTTTMPAMERAVNELKAAGVKCKILVGGAPITAEWAAQIGADGYAPDASSAADLAREMVAA